MARAGEETSEQRFRTTFEHAPIGMALVAPDGRLLDVNQRLCQLVGYSEAQLLRMTLRDLRHPDHDEAGVDELSGMQAGEIDIAQTEKRWVLEDGGVTRLMLLSSAAVDFGEAKAIGVDVALAKPVRTSQLYNQLVTVLDRATHGRETVLALPAPDTPAAAIGARVLIAEDNAINQFAATQLLQKLGFVVEIANNGREAIEMTALRTAWKATARNASPPAWTSTSPNRCASPRSPQC